MKRSGLKQFLIIGAILFLSGFTALAQDLPERPPGERPNIRTPRLLEQLNLSREQIQQIRRIHQQKQPQIRDAQERLREANRALDVAMYADELNEEDFKQRLKNVQNAQAEFFRLRTEFEFEVRKVLTPEQLAKFRQLREEFERQMEERRKKDRDRRDQPIRPEFRQPRNDRPNF